MNCASVSVLNLYQYSDLRISVRMEALAVAMDCINSEGPSQQVYVGSIKFS